MRIYKVSKHPLKNKYKVVKVGFSWTGLIFGGGWMLFKGLILRGIIFLILAWAFLLHNMVLQLGVENKDLSVYSEVMTPIMGEWTGISSLLILGFSLIFPFISGFKGNAWLHRKHLKNGYILVDTVSADSKKSAINLAKNLKEEEEYQEVISGNKECPMCAETVKARAKICRYCNHEFE